MAEGLVYYKKSVPYTVVVRRNALDSQGYSLNEGQPWVAIKADDERDFKIANKAFILQGVIVPTETPDVDWETPNALSDDEITELLKNYMALKKRLETVDSTSTLARLLEAAKVQDKSDKIKRLIRDRIDEVSGEITSPAEMQGVANQ